LFNESLKVIGIFFGADLCLTGVSLMLIAFMARLGTNVKSLPQLPTSNCRFPYIILLSLKWVPSHPQFGTF
jgi:hypothetical protein